MKRSHRTSHAYNHRKRETDMELNTKPLSTDGLSAVYTLFPNNVMYSQPETYKNTHWPLMTPPFIYMIQNNENIAKLYYVRRRWRHWVKWKHQRCEWCYWNVKWIYVWSDVIITVKTTPWSLCWLIINVNCCWKFSNFSVNESSNRWIYWNSRFVCYGSICSAHYLIPKPLRRLLPTMRWIFVRFVLSECVWIGVVPG